MNTLFERPDWSCNYAYREMERSGLTIIEMPPAQSDAKTLMVFDWALLAAIIVFTALPIGLSFERLLNPPAFEYQRDWADTWAMLHPVAVVVSPVVVWKRWWWLGAACVAVAGVIAAYGDHSQIVDGGARSFAAAMGYLVLFSFCVGRQAVDTRLTMDPPGVVTFEPVTAGVAAPVEDPADRMVDGVLATIGIAGSALNALAGLMSTLYLLGRFPIFVVTLVLLLIGLFGLGWSWTHNWLLAGLGMIATPVAWLLINDGVLLEFTLIYPVVGLLMISRYAAISRRPS